MIKNKIFIGLFALLISTAGQSCKFYKLKKSQDSKTKLKAAMDYYDQAKYAKALILFEDIILITRMTEEGDEVLYRFANTQYKIKDYILAGYYFRKYIETYPKGKYAEEAQFMSANCYYLDAPKFSLEQEPTFIAIQEFEKFVNKYPKSEKIEECNKYLDELRYKLEKKSFENAKTYYLIGYYNAAIVSLENSLKEYPDSKYKEDIYYYIFKANFEYASNSILIKQKERFEKTVKSYDRMITKFPETKYFKEIDRLNKIALKNIENLNQKEKTI